MIKENYYTIHLKKYNSKWIKIILENLIIYKLIDFNNYIHFYYFLFFFLFPQIISFYFLFLFCLLLLNFLLWNKIKKKTLKKHFKNKVKKNNIYIKYKIEKKFL